MLGMADRRNKLRNLVTINMYSANPNQASSAEVPAPIPRACTKEFQGVKTQE